MKHRHATAHAAYAYILALHRLRMVRDGDAMPREQEPVDLMMLLVLA